MKTARTTRSPGGNGNAVTATGLTRRYGAGSAAVDALRGVSLAVSDGELVGIMGPSGSGKSTLLHILAGLDRPTSGEVTIGGQVLSRLGDRDLTVLRRAQVGFVFQFFNLLPMLTCEGNIALPLKLAGTRSDPGWVDELIGKVGLSGRRGHLPSQLSGGQQQRVAIARALVSRPTVIFADEPDEADDGGPPCDDGPSGGRPGSPLPSPPAPSRRCGPCGSRLSPRSGKDRHRVQHRGCAA